MLRTCLVFFAFLTACPAPPVPAPQGEVSAPSSVEAPPPRAAEAPPGSPLAGLRAKPLDYTRHARCRMACRHISEAEVEEILQGRGALDPSRSRDDGRCPSHALEGTTSDGQRVRIVYAACEDETRVITTIDLGTDWPCGDC